MPQVLASESQVGAALSPVRVPPLLTRKDLFWLLRFYPLRWLAFVCPWLVFGLIRKCTEWIYPRMRNQTVRRAAQQMGELLGVPPEQAAKLSRSYVRHSLRSVYFDLWLLSGKPGSVEWKVSIGGREHLDRALTAGRGVLLVSLHRFGNRQARFAMREIGYPMLTVRGHGIGKGYGRLGQKWITPRYERILDVTIGERVYPRDPDCSMRLVRRLREGGIVHITADARNAATGVTVPFLKGERRISSGVLDVARVAGCAVLPISASYRGEELHIGFEAPLELRTRGSAQECASVNLGVLTAGLERQVLAHPDQWDLWVHL